MRNVRHRVGPNTFFFKPESCTFTGSGSGFLFEEFGLERLSRISVLNIPGERNCKSHLTYESPRSKDHVLTIMHFKIRGNVRHTHELPVYFFWIHRLGPRCRDQTVGKEHGWSWKVQDSQEFKQKVFDHMTSKPSAQTLMFPGRGSPLCVSGPPKHSVWGPCFNSFLVFCVVKFRIIWGIPTNSIVFLNTSCRCEMSRSDSWERACVCKIVSSRGLSVTPCGLTTHTHKSLSLSKLPPFTPNSNPNQPCFYLSDLSSPISSFYILFT